MCGRAPEYRCPQRPEKNVGSLEVRLKVAVSHLGRVLGQIAGPLRAEPSLQRGKILSLNSKRSSGRVWWHML